MWTLLACASDPTSYLPPEPVVEASIRVRAGIHDLIAHAEVPTDDPDSVTLAYEWRLDDVFQPDFTTDRIDARSVFPGQTWTVQVTATDSAKAWEPAVAEVTIPEPLAYNVVVVLLDDVGAEKIGLYGPAVPAAPTPVIDSLAAEGIVFDNAYASPMCSSTRANLLTGRHARRIGLGSIIDGDDEMLPLSSIFIPEALEQARSARPWTSIALGKWNLSSLGNDPDVPRLQGFDWYGGLLTVMSEVAMAHNSYYDWLKHENGVVLGRQEVYNTTDIFDDAIERLETLQEPFFMYIALNAAHDPLDPPPQSLVSSPVTQGNSEYDKHRAVLEAADTELGRFLVAMPVDMRANTMVIVASDNGTQPTAVEPPYDPERTKRTVYEGGVKVPLIVSGAGVAAPGGRCAGFVHVVDIFTTVSELAGVPLTDGAEGTFGLPDGELLRTIDGLSLLPYLSEPSRASVRPYGFAEFYSPNGPPPYSNDLTMVRDAEYKLIVTDDVPSLYRVPLGALDDGPDLLADGVDSTEQAELDTLSAEHDRRMSTFTYDGY